MKISLDRFDLYYYVEGVVKFGHENIWQWLIDILPNISNSTRECLRYWCERDLSCVYEDNREGSEAFQSFLRVYEIPIADNIVDELTIDMDIEHLKYLIACKGHGSHLRQDIWYDLVEHYYKRLSAKERKEIFLWAREEFKNSQDHFSFGKDDYECFLARYNPKCQYEVSYRYNDVSKGEWREKKQRVFLYNGEYHIGFYTIIKDWAMLSISNVRKIGK